MDEIAETHLQAPGENTWHPPSTAELRAAQREADAIIATCVQMPAKPDTLTTRLDAVLLHPAAGLAVLLGLLFVMFQAVFAWARPLMDLIQAGFDAFAAMRGARDFIATVESREEAFAAAIFAAHVTDPDASTAGALAALA